MYEIISIYSIFKVHVNGKGVVQAAVETWLIFNTLFAELFVYVLLVTYWVQIPVGGVAEKTTTPLKMILTVAKGEDLLLSHKRN